MLAGFRAPCDLFRVARARQLHTQPSPTYPALQAQVLAPGPVGVHVALGSQPPLAVTQELIGSHANPFPLKPGLHEQVLPSEYEKHRAEGSHPPLLVAQTPTPTHPKPSPT